MRLILGRRNYHPGPGPEGRHPYLPGLHLDARGSRKTFVRQRPSSSHGLCFADLLTQIRRHVVSPKNANCINRVFFSAFSWAFGCNLKSSAGFHIAHACLPAATSDSLYLFGREISLTHQAYHFISVID